MLIRAAYTFGAEIHAVITVRQLPFDNDACDRVQVVVDGDFRRCRRESGFMDTRLRRDDPGYTSSWLRDEGDVRKIDFQSEKTRTA